MSPTAEGFCIISFITIGSIVITSTVPSSTVEGVTGFPRASPIKVTSKSKSETPFFLIALKVIFAKEPVPLNPLLRAIAIILKVTLPFVLSILFPASKAALPS